MLHAMNIFSSIAILFCVVFAPPARGQGNLYAIDEAFDKLVSFDPETLERSVIGSLGISVSNGDLAWNHEKKLMYLVVGWADESLYSVDITTGATHHIGAHGVSGMMGLEWDSSARALFGSQARAGTHLYELDPTTGAATLVGDTGIDLDSLAHDSFRDRLLGAYAGFGEMYEIDRTTAEATLLHRGKFFDECGMKYDRDRDVFWMIDWDGFIFQYDAATFERTTMASGLGPHDGMVYVPDFPRLTLSGACPGRMSFEVSGATPGGAVALGYAFGAGEQPIPPGRPCAGVVLGLDQTARLAGVRTADANGAGSITMNVPPAACGRVFVQAVDIESCLTTDVEGL